MIKLITGGAGIGEPTLILLCAVSSNLCNFSCSFSDFECKVCFKKNAILLVSLGYISPKDVYLDVILWVPKTSIGYFNIRGNIACVCHIT